MIGLAVVLLAASPASAFEDKLTLGAGAGYAVWPGVPAAHGAALDLQAGLGLSETWQARVGAAFALHPHVSEDLALKTLSVRAEIVYLIDIVDIVPFGGVGISGLGLFTVRDAELEPAAHLVAGAAYWLSFDWLLQLDVRAHLVPDAIEGNPIYLVSTLSLVVALDR